MEQQQTIRKGNPFQVASIIMGGLAFLSIHLIIPPLILGGLAIIFAILAKGENAKMSGNNVISVVAAATALVVTVFITIAAATLIFTDGELRKQLNDYSMQIYGVTFDNMVEEGLGIDMPDLE